ncbi:MAG: DUF3253 domain-containing protein [Rhodospirillales bacterium]|jgi:hypothetical protein|nr:DUF3253 domain-containing protein [Rhodospirillales bacterium]
MSEQDDKPVVRHVDLDSRLRSTILKLLAEQGAGKTICPSDAARVERGDDWRSAMKPARRVAAKLAKEGLISIYRKGKVVDPENFKGVIRLGLPE